MPIVSFSSYPGVCQSFLSHWLDVNNALGSPTPLVLPGKLIKSTTPVALADFNDFYADLLNQRDKVTVELVNQDFARGALLDLKVALITRADQFHNAVRGNAGGTAYERSLPPLPDTDTNQTDLMSALVRVRQLWTKMNGDASLGIVLPVTLEGGYALATFMVDVAGVPGVNPGDPPLVPGVKDCYEAIAEAAGQVKLERELRNDMQEKLYELMKAYRKLVPTKFTEGDALLDSMPALTPSPGSTPDAVTITGEWNAVTGKAKFTVTGPVPENVVELEVRGLPGTEWSGDDDGVLGNIPLGGPLEFETDAFLDTPGQSISAKVFTKTAQGNEAGSNAVSVTRPA